MNLYDALRGSLDSRKLGIDINYNLPESDLYRFKISMKNKYTETITTHDGSASRSLSGIEEYEKQVFKALADAGYYIQEPDSSWSSPTLYRNVDDANKADCTFNVYLHPQGYSGIATESDIKTIMDILQKCNALSDINLVYKSKVYNLTKDEYMQVLEENRDQILTWIREYLRCGFSINTIGEYFRDLFGIPIVLFSYNSNDNIAKDYAKKLAIEYLVSLGFTKEIMKKAAYGFICQECKCIITKKRSCPYVKNYKQPKCPNCGGKIERVY